MEDQVNKSRKRRRRAQGGIAPQVAPESQAEGQPPIFDKLDAQPLEGETPDRAEPEIPSAAFQVEETHPVTKQDREHNRYLKRKSKDQAVKSALTLLAILDGAVSIALGPECAMTSDEREMISEPLARIMARLTPETTDLVDKWTDPIMLAVGFGMYLSRVFFVLKRKSEEEKPVRVNPIILTEAPPPSPNGNEDYSRMPTGVPESVAEALG
jgi:hypothetical protein